jgi:hypothetical protein
MTPLRTVHVLLSVCLITAPGCSWLPPRGEYAANLQSQANPVDLRHSDANALPATPDVQRTVAGAQPQGPVAPSEMGTAAQQGALPSQSRQRVAQTDFEVVAPVVDLSAFVQELESAPHIDGAARGQILTAVVQTPPQLQSQLIRQYRALLALGRNAATPPAAAPVQSTAQPVAVPLPAEPVFEPKPVPVIAATHSEPIESKKLAPTPKADATSDLERQLEALLRTMTASKVESATYTAADDRDDDRPAAESGGVGNPLSSDATWQQLVDSAIKKLEKAKARRIDSEVREEDEARLRMLYVIANRRDDAVRHIASLEPEMQEFWSNQFNGLATLLNSELISDRSNRLIESKRNLDEALRRLGESSPLFVRNLAFITNVDSYGAYTPFDDYEFGPGAPVLLYAEVENYRCKETARGYHTNLRSSYEIFDSRHQKVADHEFSTNEEYCKNARRDFFTVCEFRMPEKLSPGKYALRLTVADLNGEKAGESSITFHIRGESQER